MKISEALREIYWHKLFGYFLYFALIVALSWTLVQTTPFIVAIVATSVAVLVLDALLPIQAWGWEGTEANLAQGVFLFGWGTYLIIFQPWIWWAPLALLSLGFAIHLLLRGFRKLRERLVIS